MTPQPARLVATIRTAALLLAALVAPAVLDGCAKQTTLFDVWADPDAAAEPLDKILVIAMKRTPSSRRVWEDSFVASLAEHGATGVPSYRYSGETLPDTLGIADHVAAEGFDGVLVVNRAHVDTVLEHRAGSVTTAPVTFRDPWTGFYRTVYREIYEPGYVEDVAVVTQAINLWSTNEAGRLVWAATAETYDAQTSSNTSEEVVKAVVKELAEGRLLPKR